MPHVSEHFKKRLKERLHIPKKSAIKFVHKVLKNGIRTKDATTVLRRYMVSVVHHGYYPIVYNRYLIVFSYDNDTAITIFKIPKQYENEVKFIMKKRSTYNEKRKRHNN